MWWAELTSSIHDSIGLYSITFDCLRKQRLLRGGDRSEGCCQGYNANVQNSRSRGVHIGNDGIEQRPVARRLRLVLLLQVAEVAAWNRDGLEKGEGEGDNMTCSVSITHIKDRWETCTTGARQSNNVDEKNNSQILEC